MYHIIFYFIFHFSCLTDIRMLSIIYIDEVGEDAMENAMVPYWSHQLGMPAIQYIW